MNPIIESLRTDRAMLYGEAETLQLEIDSRQRRIELIHATTDGLTRAIVKLEDAETAPVEVAVAPKPKRLNTEKAILEMLALGHSTLAYIASALHRPERQIAGALDRLATAGKVVNMELVTGSNGEPVYRLPVAEQAAA